MLRLLFAALLLIQAVPDHFKSQEDVREIFELAEELKNDLDTNDEFVVDIRSLRRAERIEKLAKDIKNRMKRLN